MQVIEKVVEMENGNKVKFTAGPRYPFWRISFERGGVPAKLSGQYQYFDDAYNAVKRYLEERPSRNRTTLKAEAEVE